MRNKKADIGKNQKNQNNRRREVSFVPISGTSDVQPSRLFLLEDKMEDKIQEKKAWEMTISEFLTSETGEKVWQLLKNKDNKRYFTLKNQHERAVGRAVMEEWDIPKEVLADYPEFQEEIKRRGI